MRTGIGVAAVVAFMTASQAFAQDADLDAAAIQASAEKTSERLASNPALEDNLAARGTGGISLEAGAAAGQARIRVTGERVTGKSGWSLTLGSPVNENENFTDLASLDGLADGINLTFGWSWTKAPSSTDEKKFNDGIALCKSLKLSDQDCNNGAIEEKIRDAKNPSELSDFEQLVFGSAPFQRGTIDAKVGRQQAEFFDDVSGETTDETNIGWNVGFSYGLHFRRSLLYGKLSYELAYEDHKKVQKCSTTDLPAGLERCKSLPFGAPDEVESPKATLGWRYFAGSVAFDPKIHRNFETDVTGIELPIYLMNGGDKKFTGGVRLGWRSKVDEGQDKFSAAVFISAPLDLNF